MVSVDGLGKIDGRNDQDYGLATQKIVMNDKIINPRAMDNKRMHEQRSVVNATDLEGASSMIAPLDHDTSQIQDMQREINHDNSSQEILTRN